MTDKKLKHLSRAELLEMLLAQMEENEKLNQKLQETEAALAERRIDIEQAGTMAEAAMRLNDVFDAADKAARQYLENAQRLGRERAQQIELEARQNADAILAQARAGIIMNAGEPPYEE